MKQLILTSVVLLFAAASVRSDNPPGGIKTVTLKNGELQYFEQDDGKGISLFHDHGKFIVNTDANGRPLSHIVQVGNISYADLNGDGLWDTKYDGNQKKAFILLDGQDLAVRHDPMYGAYAKEKVSSDGNTTYIFTNSSWNKKE